MIPALYRLFIIVIGSVLLLAAVCSLVNRLVYQFPGNHYIPDNYFLSAIVLVLSYIGSRILFGARTRWASISLQLLMFFLVMSSLAFITNSIQYTPYPPIDTEIIALETAMGIHLPDLMDWIQQYPGIKWLMAYSYDSLALQMALLPLLLIVTNQPSVNQNEHRLCVYYILMLWTVFVGFAFYYFFPTTAPASNMLSPWFMQSQYDTGIKFTQIRQYIAPTTMDGGMIALPSFHSIWAILCVYLIWPWPWARMLLIINNGILLLACVFLGWHYPLDILASIIILLFSLLLFYPLIQRSAPTRLLSHD
ncbi:MAG: phosphatase PAP2 family protein [Legionellaceae bacterium]|nr:phosphatase PAP2 family protein [Legionellaceae bacterium]